MGHGCDLAAEGRDALGRTSVTGDDLTAPVSAGGRCR